MRERSMQSWRGIVERLAAAAPVMPDGMGAFLAGIVLLAVPVIAMVASATAPTQAGHWVVLAIGLALIVFGVARGRPFDPG